MTSQTAPKIRKQGRRKRWPETDQDALSTWEGEGGATDARS
jgi:hypothetical protein